MIYSAYIFAVAKVPGKITFSIGSWQKQLVLMAKMCLDLNNERAVAVVVNFCLCHQINRKYTRFFLQFFPTLRPESSQI